ncbi:MAG: hypothetical protein HC923_00105 [Myxococcales bacterium]|nr:hypothetical protein [Myxococcales bacterium]
MCTVKVPVRIRDLITGSGLRSRLFWERAEPILRRSLHELLRVDALVAPGAAAVEQQDATVRVLPLQHE